MRKFITLAASVIAALVLASPAVAVTHTTCHDRGVLHRYSWNYHRVVKLHGKLAPGRNIRRYGMTHRRSHCRDLAASKRVLVRLAHPQPYLAIRATRPTIPPAGTYTATASPTGVASCIVARESGGNPTATNGQYGGIAQWSPEAWARMGGTHYASTPQGASYQDQLQVLNNGLKHYGSRDWSPYDGC